jgi:hypothetical protein
MVEAIVSLIHTPITIMPPRIEPAEEQDTTVSPPGSPLLSSRVLVGNNNHLPLLIHSSTNNPTKDENTSLMTFQDKLSWTLHMASQQHHQLLDSVEDRDNDTLTALQDACLFSLRGTATKLIQHASRLVETMDDTRVWLPSLTSSSSTLLSTTTTTTAMNSMGRVRASLAVRWALQYLDSISNALHLQQQQQQPTFSSQPDEDDLLLLLNHQLQRVLDQVVVSSSTTHSSIIRTKKQRSFRISPWILSSSRWTFDLVVGEAATWSNHTMLSLTVDPVWQVQAEDLVSSPNKKCILPTTCTLNVVQVTDRGNGQALVKVRISPSIHQKDYNSMEAQKKKKVMVWGHEKQSMMALQKAVRVEEARV